MLKVFLHSSAFRQLSSSNLIGRLDIAYEELAVYADYKVAMVQAGVGERPIAFIRDYPRWSASVWDLVARAICVCLHDVEQLPSLPRLRSGPFMQYLTAGIEHWPDGFSSGRSTIGVAQITMCRKRRQYNMKFEDDIMGVTEGRSMVYTPRGELNAWDLLARAYSWARHGSQELPPRPSLAMPPKLEVDGETWVPIEHVAEPALTGLRRWMDKECIPLVPLTDHKGHFVRGDHFSKFLNRAV